MRFLEDLDADFPLAKEIVQEKYNRDVVDILQNELLELDELYVIAFEKTQQRWDALLRTERHDGLYFELSHDETLGETQIVVYERVSKETISDDSR